ncbi:NAD(P)H-dependent flavin oxidoreductase [Actinomadura scrupuli]|uniref:NAD(P)H-dependent flavin oxidoreductase n=1 Tax=Actinomadura scrupuli TaxID=559629 RepID=UPI003D96BD5A
MTDLRDLFGVPIIQAPMAGGASRPVLAAAVSAAGGLGFLAAGYKRAEQVRAEITQTRALTDRPFGVNLFVPAGATAAAPAVDLAAVGAYQDRLAPEAARLGVPLGTPTGDDDDWDAKLADLLADPPAVVSFVFGCPSKEVIEAFQAKGVFVIVTVTSAAEAVQSAAADALCVQGIEAGAHRGTFTNDPETVDEGTDLLKLLAEVRQVSDLPLIAAGGLVRGADLAGALAGGATAAQLGTAFLRSPESGASPAHKAALADPRFTATALTRAFTGRPARGLVNRFLAEYSPLAPAAYPHIHHLTSPLRRAAAQREDPDTMALWAGQGFRHVTADPAAVTVARLAGELAAAR